MLWMYAVNPPNFAKKSILLKVGEGFGISGLRWLTRWADVRERSAGTRDLCTPCLSSLRVAPEPSLVITFGIALHCVIISPGEVPGHLD